MVIFSNGFVVHDLIRHWQCFFPIHLIGDMFFAVWVKFQFGLWGFSFGGQKAIIQPTLNLLIYYFTNIFHAASCMINVRV